jgi:ATP-dependent DNA helicase PIF1
MVRSSTSIVDILATLDKLTKNVVGEKNGILPTQIFTRNSDVADLNDRYLRECEGEEFVFSTEDIYDFEDKLLRSRLTKDMDERIPQQLPLKVGAQVLLTKNLDVKRGLVNGSRGVVTGTL